MLEFLPFSKGKKMKTLTVIDTFGLFFRLFYALKSLKNSKGKDSGMIKGFADFIYTLESEFQSDYIIFALDSKGEGVRNDIDKDYKSNRTEPPQELKEQLPICIQMIKDMGFAYFEKQRYEADDIIASVVRFCEDKDIFVRIISQDKDLYQLIKNDKVSIYSPISKNEYDEEACFEKYGVKPSKIRDFLALCGDSSDNIKGVKGIGAKGAKKLLDEFDTIEDIYTNLNLVRNERTKTLLMEGKNDAFVSKKLATLYDDLELDLNLNECKKPDKPLLSVLKILEEYELNALLKRINAKNIKNTTVTNYKSILINDENKLFEILEKLDKNTVIAFDTETTGLDSKTAKIVGFSFAINENEAFYVPLAHKNFKEQISMQVAKKAIQMIFENFVVGHNLKYDFEIIERNFNLPLPEKYADTMILAWLKEPNSRINMDSLAKKFFNHDTIHFEDIVKKGENFSDIDINEACKYACEDAYISLKFYFYFLENLEKELFDIALRYEFPFIKTLLRMQQQGIKLDTSCLERLMRDFKDDIDKIKDEIYKLADENFNINSPQQVAFILFEKLSLKSSKKGKSGVLSTDEKVLQELINEHLIVKKILDYRELSKLYSTYCEPLLKLALKDDKSRIYSHFLQSGTATGRLSSKEPNLQNIPAHGKYAKSYKSCFVAEEGFSFLSIDYSQIELRMLAHFSEDEKLLNAFKNDEDIHSKTALMIFNEVNDKTRSIAKSINFGLIYGMGYKSLSKNLQIEAKDAKIYIERYFDNFTSIKTYFEKVKSEAKKNGFIKTLLGRKRYFNFSEVNAKILASYERESVNSILQGSAADVIKLAMLEIDKYLDNEKRLILQIHDELIFEVKDEIMQNFANFAENIMQNIVKLKVSLKTSSSIAKNWGDLK